jgi:predicted nucleic acid-binding protein
MDLLISDTCILIDLLNGKLLNMMRELPYNLGVSDAILYGIDDDEPELIVPNSEQVLSAGFQVYPLNSHEMIEVFELYAKYSRPSLNDIFGLVVAKKNNAILLTSDGSLRRSALKEKVEVRGILWILDEMINNKVIDKKTAATSLNKIRAEGSYLPKNECDIRLEKWIKKI